MAEKMVLVADDEKDLVMVIKDFLESEGFKVVTASNGEEALNRFFEFKPALVLLDLAMPKLDGISVLEKIKSHTPGANVAIITAYRDAEKIVKAFRLGAVDCIFKPFDIANIREIVKKYLNK